MISSEKLITLEMKTYHLPFVLHVAEINIELWETLGRVLADWSRFESIWRDSRGFEEFERNPPVFPSKSLKEFEEIWKGWRGFEGIYSWYKVRRWKPSHICLYENVEKRWCQKQIKKLSYYENILWKYCFYMFSLPRNCPPPRLHQKVPMSSAHLLFVRYTEALHFPVSSFPATACRKNTTNMDARNRCWWKLEAYHLNNHNQNIIPGDVMLTIQHNETSHGRVLPLRK